MGASFTRSLSVGTHIVKATVSDREGLSTSKQVTIAVATAPPDVPGTSVALSATQYKVRGAQIVDLTWSGASSASVDIYRNSVRILTTTNDGLHTDPIDRKGKGAYTYQVCEAGTSYCSNSVRIVF
jgi:hypothetical protein